MSGVTAIQHLVKSHLFIGTNLFHVELCPKSSGIQNRVRLKRNIQLSVPKGKNCSISGFDQQLACPVPTAGVDLVPLVEGGRGRSKHDKVLLLQTKTTHSCRGVKAACSGEDLPGDSVGGPPVLELPDMRG